MTGNDHKKHVQLFRLQTNSNNFKQLFCRSYQAVTEAGLSIRSQNYYLIYDIKTNGVTTINELYSQINKNLKIEKAEFKILVSDVIVITDEETSAYYVDLFGFINVTPTFVDHTVDCV